LTLNSPTFVTGFWDPESLGRGSSRSARSYLRLFEELHASLPFSLVVFADPKHEEEIRRIVRGSGLPRYVERMPLEELPRMQERERFQALRPMENAGDGKDTLEFAIVTWSKVDLLARVALEESQQDASHVAWIDFGVAHVCDPASIDWHKLTSRMPFRARICEMRATARHELEDLAGYYSHNRGRVAAVSSPWAEAPRSGLGTC
jgi:hypothetical protein